jgi:hypothetical protein
MRQVCFPYKSVEKIEFSRGSNRMQTYGKHKMSDRFVLSAKLIHINKHTQKQLFYPHGTLYYTQMFNYVNN